MSSVIFTANLVNTLTSVSTGPAAAHHPQLRFGKFLLPDQVCSSPRSEAETAVRSFARNDFERVMLKRLPNQFRWRNPNTAITRRGVVAGIGLVVLSSLTAGDAIAEGKSGSTTTAVTSIAWGPGPQIWVYKSDGDQIIGKAWDGNGPGTLAHLMCRDKQ